ncbi:MAG: hypothetical protein PHN38_08595 [Sulfurospirillaceae bacterium]|nr:hypothetical protein [Sulfurospirillaceae bacterium]
MSEAEFNEKKTALLNALSSSIKNPDAKKFESGYWFSIPSMIFGIIVMLACFDESNWTRDTTVGAFIFITLGLILGVIGVSTQEKGKGMAIAGIVLCSLSALIVIGSQ